MAENRCKIQPCSDLFLCGHGRSLTPAPMNAASPPHPLTALLQQAQALHQVGRWAEARHCYQQILAAQPDQLTVLNNLAVLEFQQGRYEAGIELLERCLRINPAQPIAHYSIGRALQLQQHTKEALAHYEQAIELKPDFAEALNNRGLLLQGQGYAAEALASYERALAAQPHYVEALNNRGSLLKEQGQLDEALDCFARALALQPQQPDLHKNHADVLAALRQSGAALQAYKQAIDLKPDFAAAYVNRGLLLLELRQPQEALNDQERALQAQPDSALALANRGNALKALNRLDEALVSFRQALALQPDTPGLPGLILHTQMHLCDWRGIDEGMERLRTGLQRGQPVADPFTVLAALDDPGLQLQAARLQTQAKAPVRGAPLAPWPQVPGRKIRIGYYSADFHNHATMHLMAELFERHDRTRFEFHAFSFGRDSNDAWRQRAVAAFDRFHDVHQASDAEVVALSRQLQIDIALDLKGHTVDARPGIFERRAAPLQLNYLGYPGSMGADSIDYIVADPVLIPPASQAYYQEQVIYLPHSYQPNPAQKALAEEPANRAAAGLPAQGFVFCSFNNNYKITPAVFDSWMRILQATPGSLLWLFISGEQASAQLRREAAARNVDPARLLFASNLPNEEHLRRISLGDLFLDTWPCNAHTTASDALRMGLPLLTRRGKSFASRVAASLLQAVGLPELITENAAQYEALAIELAQQPERLAALRQRLRAQQPLSPLYDSGQLARNLEQAFEAVLQRQRDGLPPEHLWLQP